VRGCVRAFSAVRRLPAAVRFPPAPEAEQQAVLDVAAWSPGSLRESLPVRAVPVRAVLCFGLDVGDDAAGRASAVDPALELARS